MSSLALDQVLATPLGDLAALDGETLFRIKNEAADLLSAARSIAEHIDRALELKYADRAQSLRLAAGKDTGVVHFDDGRVQVTADLPKRVEWDQKRIAEIARRIAEGGEDPTEYIDVRYSVSERKFAAWPESLRRPFEAARTIKTGKPTFRLALVGEGK